MQIVNKNNLQDFWNKIYIKFTGMFLSKNNTTEYNPIENYNPATKKYADESVENYGIFVWDGKSSTDNPDNIALWQKIYDTSRIKNVFVIGIKDNSNTEYSAHKFMLFIPKNINLINNQLEIYSSPSTAYSSDSKTGSSTTIYMYGVSINFQNNLVTNVVVLANSEVLAKYLPTDKTTVNNFTPTYDYHPATKKYVDDSINEKITNVLGGEY